MCNFNSDALQWSCNLVTDTITVTCSVTWPLNGGEAGGDLVLIQTSDTVFLCVNQVAPLPLKSQFTERTSVQ